jgi:hypothetical protein
MTLKNILLTMHDDELGYEIFAIDDPKQIFY